MDDELLFETVDPRGYRVVLSAERYYGHIISSDGGHNPHPEFSPDEIKSTIQKPIAIWEGREPDSDVYFAKTSSQYPTLFMKVAVSTYDDCGDVTSAFLSKEMKGGIKEGGLKYVNYSNGLR